MISVDDALPLRNQRVWCFWARCAWRPACVAWLVEIKDDGTDRWRANNGGAALVGAFVSPPTHWAPLPEPPE